MLPAHERLEGDDAALGDRDDRLEVEDELVLLERAAQVVLAARRARRRGAASPGRRGRAARRPAPWRGTWRPRRRARASRRVWVAGSAMTTPTLAVRKSWCSSIDERRGERGEQPLGRARPASRSSATPSQSDGELVAGEARRASSPGAQRAAQALGQREQQLVAGRRPEGVVDVLEAVDVEEDDRGGPTAGGGAPEGVGARSRKSGRFGSPVSSSWTARRAIRSVEVSGACVPSGLTPTPARGATASRRGRRRPRGRPRRPAGRTGGRRRPGARRRRRPA